MDKVVKDLNDSLNDPKQKSKIVVVDQRCPDQHGIPKAACFQRFPLKIEIHGETWLGLNTEERLVTVAFEISGLSGLTKKRYQDVDDEIRPLTDKILVSEKVPELSTSESLKEKPFVGGIYVNPQSTLTAYEIVENGEIIEFQGGVINPLNPVYSPHSVSRTSYVRDRKLPGRLYRKIDYSVEDTLSSHWGKYLEILNDGSIQLLELDSQPVYRTDRFEVTKREVTMGLIFVAPRQIVIPLTFIASWSRNDPYSKFETNCKQLETYIESLIETCSGFHGEDVCRDNLKTVKKQQGSYVTSCVLTATIKIPKN